MRVISGVLLPATIFEQPWFFYLAAFVAFNTIMFVGLSLAKLIRWPRPRIADDTVPLIDRTTISPRRSTPNPDSRHDHGLPGT